MSGGLSSNGFGRLFSKIRGKTVLPGAFNDKTGQRINGAEAMLGQEARPLAEQLSTFESVYSRVFVSTLFCRLPQEDWSGEEENRLYMRLGFIIGFFFLLSSSDLRTSSLSA